MTAWEWYDDPITLSVWLHILLEANFDNKRWHGIEIKRGQLLTSLLSLQESFRGKDKNGNRLKKPSISYQQIRTALEHLKSTNEITIHPTPNYTLISINNYAKYQQVTKVSTNEQQTSNKRVTTTKEYKNEKNKEIYKEISSEKILEIAERYGVSEKSVKETYEDLILYCKSKGKTYKDYEAALMTWVRNNIKSGKTKIVPQTIKVEPIDEFTDEQRQNNLKRLSEMRAKLPIILHQ